MKKRGRFILLVIDGLGVGAQEDAGDYGDENADTLGHVCRETQCVLPNFQRLGLGNITELSSVQPADNPLASWGMMREVSPGKDSTTGHWELAGIHLERPFPLYPEGFPDELIDSFCRGVGCDKVLCNLPYSGTQVINDYGEEHLDTGFPIVYTSADSVFQVACHVDVAPVETLYNWCKFAREEVFTGRHGVGRVIARPFEGRPGGFERISEKRHDYSITPPVPNLISLLNHHEIKVWSIGKVVDLFAEKGFAQYRRTRSNAEGISQLLSLLSSGVEGLIFVNLIDTDQLYGHRQDPEGYARSLQEIDRALPAIFERLGKEDLLIITSDHGNDPADDSTDHTREYVPLLASGRGASPSRNLGLRETFSDVAASALHFFRLDENLPGDSFLEIRENNR